MASTKATTSTRRGKYTYWGPYLTEKTGKQGRRKVTYWTGKVLFKRDGDDKRCSRTRVFKVADDPEAESITKTEASRQALAWLQEIQDEHAESERIHDTDKDVPAFVEWCISADETNGTEASTIYDYRKSARYLHRGLSGHGLEGVPLKDLTPDMVERWKSSLLSSGGTDGGPLAPVTVKKAMSNLHRYMRYAVSNHYIDTDPCAGVKLPKKSTMSLDANGDAQIDEDVENALDAQQRTYTLAMLDTMAPAPYAVAIRIAIYAGLRRNEIVGLRWRDLDFTEGLIHVRRSIGEAEVGTSGNKASTYEKTPKSTAGIRTIPMFDDLGEYLWSWRSACDEKCRAAGIKLSDEAFVIGDPLTGTHAPISRLSASVKFFFKSHSIVGITGETPTMHDLRRTFSKWIQDELEFPMGALFYYMGHKPNGVTQRNYTPMRVTDKSSPHYGRCTYDGRAIDRADGRMRVTDTFTLPSGGTITVR